MEGFKETPWWLEQQMVTTKYTSFWWYSQRGSIWSTGWFPFCLCNCYSLDPRFKELRSISDEVFVWDFILQEMKEIQDFKKYDGLSIIAGQSLKRSWTKKKKLSKSVKSQDKAEKRRTQLKHLQGTWTNSGAQDNTEIEMNQEIANYRGCMRKFLCLLGMCKTVH